MEKLTITNLVDFNRKSAKSRQTLVNNLKAPKIKDADDSGGNYWMSALSCLGRAFLENPEEVLSAKIDQLIGEIETKEHKRTKNRWQRNINILQDFEVFDFNQLRPPSKLTYLKKPKDKCIVPIKGLSLFVNPHHVFTFQENEVKKVGAVWFLAKSGGFRREELVMVVDLLYRYLSINHSTQHEISSDYCLVVDASTLTLLPYSQIGSHQIKSPLLPLVDEMNKLI